MTSLTRSMILAHGHDSLPCLQLIFHVALRASAYSIGECSLNNIKFSSPFGFYCHHSCKPLSGLQSAAYQGLKASKQLLCWPSRTCWDIQRASCRKTGKIKSTRRGDVALHDRYNDQAIFCSRSRTVFNLACDASWRQGQARTAKELLSRRGGVGTS